MHCSRNHARSCTCRFCSGIRTCSCTSVYSAEYLLVAVLMHALASALRLHGFALPMCVYFTENTGFDSCTCTWTLQPAEYRCMVKVCAPWVGQRRVYMYTTKKTRTRANFTSLVCTAFCSPLCAMLPGTSESISFRLAPECSTLPSYSVISFPALTERKQLSYSLLPPPPPPPKKKNWSLRFSCKHFPCITSVPFVAKVVARFVVLPSCRRYVVIQTI